MTRRSETNEAESNKALAITVEPFDASTRTLQVISNEFCTELASVFDEMSATLWSDLDNVEGGVAVVCGSMWSRVW